VLINKNNRILQVVFSFIACSFHLSLLLPVILWFIYSNSKCFISVKITLLIWFICLLLLFLNIPFFSTVLETLDLESIQARMNNYIQMDNSNYKTGMRYDFIGFSFIFIIIGLFMRKKIYTDVFYEIILKIYITANAVFLLSLHFPYSDRYGTLSWSLIPIMYSYPLLKSAKKNNIFILYVSILGMLVLSLLINL
jgi:hypothetical protein